MYKDCFNFTMLLLYLLYSMYSMIPLKIATSFTPQLNFEKEEDLHWPVVTGHEVCTLLKDYQLILDSHGRESVEVVRRQVNQETNLSKSLIPSKLLFLG